MGILQCEQNFRDVWIRNKSVRAEIGLILHTDTHTHPHTHTTAAKLVVRFTPQRVAKVTFFSHNNPASLLRHRGLGTKMITRYINTIDPIHAVKA